MSLDLITEIQASPREFAQKYETMRAALELSEASKTVAADELRELRAALDEARRVATGQAFRADQFKAALERARALVPFLRGWIETMQSEQGYEDEGTMAWRSWQDMIAEVENVIAALAGADGAAPVAPAAPTCDLCKIQAGIKAAMDIIEPLPEIGDHYDAMVTRAFDALDDAYGFHRHEHSADGAPTESK